MIINTISLGNIGATTDETLEFVKKKSKRQNKFGKYDDIQFIYNELSSQYIKLPRKLTDQICAESDPAFGYSTEDGITAVVHQYELFSISGNGANLKLDLNLKSFSPYVRVTKDSTTQHRYVILTINTEKVKLIQYDRSLPIMGTFKYPKKNLLGCIIDWTSSEPINIWTKDDQKKSFKKWTFTIGEFSETSEEAEAYEPVNVETTTEFEKEEFKSLNVMWRKKQTTRTFLYNYDVKPNTMLTYREDAEVNPYSKHGACLFSIHQKKIFDNTNDFTKSIASQVKGALGYVPKAVLLASDVTDLTYDDMLKLHFNYVLREEEDGSISTMKSN